VIGSIHYTDARIAAIMLVFGFGGLITSQNGSIQANGAEISRREWSILWDMSSAKASDVRVDPWPSNPRLFWTLPRGTQCRCPLEAKFFAIQKFA